jgi:uncharacterized protein (TIGR03067 family)
MNLFTAWALVGASVLSGGDAADAIKKDKAALQGTWKVTASISKGDKATAEEIKDLHLIFRGDAILVREDGKAQENFFFNLDPLKKIKEVDLILKVGPQKGRIDRGIYEIDGDTLRICIQSNKDSSRPRDFRSPAGSDLWLVTLQRSKE